MKMFKFQDTVDGNFAYVIAKDSNSATKALKEFTSLPFIYVDHRELKSLNTLIYRNNILPF